MAASRSSRPATSSGCPGGPVVREPGRTTGAGSPPGPAADPLDGDVAGIGELSNDADPVTFLLVGTREAPTGRPPEMSVFNVFFDSPAKRPFQAYRSKLDLKRVRVTSQGHRTTVAVGDLTIGPFAGELQFTVYDGSPLVHVETVVRTQEDRRAILYDTGPGVRDPGIDRGSPGWTRRASFTTTSAESRHAAIARSRSGIGS